ncbi:HesA/MoeB/ThiF family protein [Moraxella sp. ZY210820]|uniref:HesA/MoeB/ThiF family protein n=1 Tax=unclassified Moraxella TaxID=2685852 RepID=UPI002730A4CD|nr:HesA/MoeB/ThiF family protein [Moraxella sp. ZY210820]WLF84752.1 HesA/MoeB/ThiF family protein [Moraxella sp. ZY210820]
MQHTNLPAIELNDDELFLYSRQILLDDWDLEAQQKLKNSQVLIIGAGGLGCTSAEILARSGVGHMSIIDFDCIEISNLQRQIAFHHQHIGQSKALTLAKHLQEINPHIEVVGLNQRFDANIDLAWFSQFDVVLDGCDRFKTRYAVNTLCKQANIPLISASAIGLQGQLLMLEGQSACYQCLFPIINEDEEQGSCATSGVLASTPIVMASLQAHHTLLYLGLGQMPLREKILLWNGQTMTQKIVRFQHDENCEVCKTFGNLVKT